MKKILTLLVVFLCSWVSAFAQSVKIYSTGNYKAKPGETIKFSLSMKNDIDIKAWSFRLVLPEGVTVEKNNRGRYVYQCSNSRLDGHSTDAQDTKNDPIGVQFSVYGNYPFLENDGEILSLNLVVSENVSLGNQEIRLAKINYANMDNASVYQDDLSIPLKIYKTFNISAQSADEKMGTVTLSHSGEVENGTSVTATATPVEGCSFVNWTVGDVVKSTESSFTFKAAEDMALVANFKANKYDVTFDVDGTKTTTSADFGSVITAPADPTKTGYTFTGWSPALVEGATVPVDGITYSATWKINQYTITFDTDGGSEIAPITKDYGTSVTAPSAPTKTGYTFTGWDKEIPSTVPAENVIIKALWTVNQYTITFDTDGGSEIAPITQDYNSAVTAPADPTKTGYTFAGWDKEIPATIPAEDMTIKALWTVNKYTITFDTDGGTEVASITQDYGTSVTSPSAPTKTGYTFVAWDKEIPATIPAEDMTIKATWQINQYTITFDTDGGTEVASITQDYGTSVTSPSAPTKTGYTFAGWDKEIPATIPAEDMTIKATWQINQYTITFDTDGGSEVAAITQDYASAVTAPADPTKTGYTFKGWDKEIPATIPAEDMTIKALWTVNQYTITYYVDGVEVYSETVDYGAALTVYDYKAENGREFNGWTEEIPATMPAHDVTIYGSTTIATFISSHFANSGESVTVYTLNGTRVMTLDKASDIKRLSRGTYIINGRKVVIRK